MDYFTKSETFSAHWPFIYADNKLYFHKKKKKKKKILTDYYINHNLGDSAAEGTVSEPACHFQHR